MFYRQIAIDAIDKTIAAANSSGQIDHPGLKGRLREIVVEELIKPFLSPRVKTASGMIVDPTGKFSKQIDIILYDELVTPPIQFAGDVTVIPCHAAVATVEVKSNLNARELESAIKNARSVKNLKTEFRRMSREAGYRRIIDEQVIYRMDESREKEFLKALLKISSTACYLFAFDSTLRLGGNPRKEYIRLQKYVERSNAKKKSIDVPISGLCVADRVFHHCVHAEDPVKFIDIEADQARPEDWDQRFWVSHNVVLKFISEIVEVVNLLASQRWRIPLEVYFETEGGNS
jgi:hypothetical protein